MCAEAELFGGHEAGGAEHPPHSVETRATSVAVKVDYRQLPRAEFDHEASVVEVGRYPTEVRQVLVKVDQGIEDPEKPIGGKPREARW